MTTTADNSGPTMAGEERDFIYKGKTTRRSWPQLPEELIRLIGTFYLLNISATAYVPYTWEAYEHWPQRLVYTAIRDGLTLERNVMAVCTGWHRALQTHSIWSTSIPLLDPANLFGSYVYAAQPQNSSGRLSPQAHRQPRAGKAQAQVTPWRHSRYILSCGCIVCRINSPTSSFGFTVPNGHRRPLVYTSWLGSIPVCRDHEKRKASFCGACLRDNPTLETAALQSLIGFGPGISPHAVMQQHQNVISAQIMEIACMENEDEEMWPGIEATCKSCRLEWLWRKACMQPSDREAIGGPAPPDPPHSRPWFPIPSLHTLLQNSTDWEIRHSIEGFVDMAEGTITEVLTMAREKHWLQKHTRLRELMSQALAARRWVSSAVGESVMSGINGDGRGEPAQIHSQNRPYGQQQEPDTHLEVDNGINQNDSELERAQLALDMELAVQLEREERDREEGEYDETRAVHKRARTPSPPVERSLPPHMQRREERQTCDPPATIQFAPEATTYPNTYYPTSSPRTNTTTTTTVISLDDAELERFDDVDNDARSQTYARSDISDDHLDDEEEEEEEEDASVMQTVEKSVLQLALDDWTRSKILDGYWISPADVWYGNDKVYTRHVQYFEFEDEAEDDVPNEGGDGRGKGRVERRKEGWTMAVHPCPWAIEKESESEDFAMSNPQSEEESRPRWDTVIEPGPLTFSQAEQVYHAHQKQMRLALLPAMRNVVRKLVIECGAAAFPEDVYGDDQTQRRTRTESTSSSSSNGSLGRKRKRWTAPSGKWKGLRDPALIASRMSLEDVVKVLREEEGVWFDGFDWLEKRRNVREAEENAAAKRKRDTSRISSLPGSGPAASERAIHGDGKDKPTGTPTTESPPKKRRKTQDGEVDSGMTYAAGSTSTPPEGSTEEDGTSSGSSTSPVLSTTTLQTTPSPPPSNSVPLEGGSKGKAAMKVELEEGDSDGVDYDNEPPVRIPVGPVLESPRILRTIPYVPLTLEGFPHYTVITLKTVWREATAPLYQCRCRICERAATAAAMAEQRRRGHASSDATEYSRDPQQEQRDKYERERTAPPPPSPRREGEEQQQPYRIPAIRLRPAKPDLPRREEEEEEEYESPSADEDEFMKIAAEADLGVEVESNDPMFEKIIYHPPEEDEKGDDEVVEIDIQDVDVFNDTKAITTPTKPTQRDPPGLSFSADGTPIRSARKRSCDDQELELDHTGRTVSVASLDDAVPRAVSSVTGNLREYAIRPPSPPKRQKTTAS